MKFAAVLISYGILVNTFKKKIFFIFYRIFFT